MEKLFLAPWVVALRWQNFLAGLLDPTPAHDRENRRMVAEKLSAASEGYFSLWRVGTGLALDGFRAWALGARPRLDATAAATKLLRAALLPSARRVGANARRLSRPRR